MGQHKSKLWVTINGKDPIEVCTEDCDYIYEFADIIRKQEQSSYITTDFSVLSAEGKKIEMNSRIVDLLDSQNSFDRPISMRTVKSVTVLEVDEKGAHSGRPRKIVFQSQEHFLNFMNRNKSFWMSDEPKDPSNEIFHFDELIDGGIYFFIPASDKWAIRLRKKDAEAKENTVTESIVSFLNTKGLSNLAVLNGELMSGSKVLQEWDSAVYSAEDGCLYLAEAKHSITEDDLNKMESKLVDFPRLLGKTNNHWKLICYKQIKLVACGTNFPENVQRLAEEKGILIVRPSGFDFKG